MSFQDIESTRAPLIPASREDAAFHGLQSSLSLKVFKMNANVQGMLKLVDQLGTTKDSENLRKKLHDLTETTRAMAKRSSADLKQLTMLQTAIPSHKAAVQKVSHDLQMSLVALQRAQQVSAESQRTVVQGVKLAAEESEQQASGSTPSADTEHPTQTQRQAQLLHTQFSASELAHHEALVHEREVEIREIEAGIHELAEIFRDLGTMVNQQGEMVGDIGVSVSSIADDTHGAATELTTAAKRQHSAGRRAMYLMLILAFVVGVVLLAVLQGVSN